MASSLGNAFNPAYAVQKAFNSGSPAAKPLRWQPYAMTFAVMNIAFLFVDPRQTLNNWGLLSFFAPIWFPALVGYFAWLRFVQMNKAGALARTETVLLELRMPRDTMKTPLAMEAILSNLHLGSGEATAYKRNMQGGTRPWFSLEIASIGGRIRFFLWTRENLRRGIESFFYAQYPDMEIVEAEDYSRLVDPAGSEYSMFAAEFEHTKPDPYPIKTYVDYKLDLPGAKPEEQIDPLAQMLELLGGIGPKEQIWLQFVIRMTKSEKYPGLHTKDGRSYTWKDEATDLIEKVRQQTAVKGNYTDPVTGKVQETQGFPNLSKGQSNALEAIERNISKQGFDVGMRAIYTASKEAYEGGKVISFMLGSMMKPFSSESHNSFKPLSEYDAKFQDYPWEDPHGTYKQELHEEAVENYRRRAFFHEPYVGNWMIMSTEEIATLFHIPSATVVTPSLPRIQSTTSAFPTNLPT